MEELPEGFKYQVAARGLRLFTVDVDKASWTHEVDSPGKTEVLATLLLSLLLPAEKAWLVDSFARTQSQALQAVLTAALGNVVECAYPRTWLDATQGGAEKATAEPVLVPQPFVQGLREASLVAQGSASADPTYLQLFSHVFGERVVLADVTGRASLFDESYTPVSSVSEAEIMKIFSAQSEQSYGLHLGHVQRRQRLKKAIEKLLSSSSVTLPETLRISLR